MQDLVSVLVPSYNHSKYIIETLESIKKSSYKSIEICIIDDGSSDDSILIIQKWIDNSLMNIKFKHRKNRGLTKTLNELLEMASGRYIVLLGSDDVLTEDSILQRVVFLKSNPHKKAVFTDAYIINSIGEKIFNSALFEYKNTNKNKLLDSELIKEELILNWNVPGPVLLFEKSVIEMIGNYNENLIVEDWDFYLRLVSNDLLIYQDKALSGYRLHNSNTINNSELHFKIKIDRLKTVFLNFFKFDFKYKILFLKLIFSKIR
ncbi:MAG: Chondroitin synthase [uncultured Campylobacterales bacterium]|uniref:Chondroitin synthase n=1 Tax=uncultured Campylobacterales bacterium TaxID=352960 RepID=A0A6S6T183_9BACT|nr:MAG: Chondroitin synthase [uncultured Campylobacterales bacterium]